MDAVICAEEDHRAHSWSDLPGTTRRSPDGCPGAVGRCGGGAGGRLLEPGEGALDDPAVASEPGAVFGLAACDHGFDAALTDEAAVLVVVVPAVGDDGVWSLPRPADTAA